MSGFLSEFGRFFKRTAFAIFLTAGLLTACTGSNGPAIKDPQAISDPIEPVNRIIFAFNDALDTLLLRPAAVTYRDWTPEPVKDSVQSFLRLLGTPVTFFNDVFQTEWDRAETSAARFGINLFTLGLYDLAADQGYPYHSEDFGQTLAVHGVDDGFYLMLPILGPSNVRDATGRAVDFFIDPLSLYTFIEDESLISINRALAEAVRFRSQTIALTDDLQANSLDYYAAVRSLYYQQRNLSILNGRVQQAAPSKADAEAFEELLQDEQVTLAE